jgi:hypothetical protein
VTADPVPREAERRAEASFRSVTRRRLYDRKRRLFGSRRCLRDRRYEALWPFADAWSAITTLGSLGRYPAAVSVSRSLFDGLAAYRRSLPRSPAAAAPEGFESIAVPPLGSGGDVFFDDNSWVALALLGHDELTGDGRALTLARRLLEFVESGWSTEPSWAHPGGVRWKVPASCVSRNTCSNGPVAEVAARIHERTGDPAALEWSIRIYRWVRRALLGPDALYFDRIEPGGSVVRDVWSYNQGTMIGAGVLLHRITGDPGYLEEAIATADAAMDWFSVSKLVDPDGPAFSAMFFRNLFLLGQARPDPRYRQLAVAYGDEMWRHHRDRRTGLFVGSASLLNGSAPMIEIYALIAGAPPHP